MNETKTQSTMNKQNPSFTDLLNNEDFRATYADYEWHVSMDHPATQDLAEALLRNFNYKVA
jgi:hypothetical protein